MDLSLIYTILLVSSPVFGVETLMLSNSKIFLANAETKKKLILYSVFIGLSITGSSIGLTRTLDLQPLFSCAIVLGLILIIGKFLHLKSVKSSKKRKKEPKNVKYDGEIENILKKKGLGELIENEDRKE